jgi:hypothetical protein
MFIRTHRIGRHSYTEVLESYRDPDTGCPRHRCLVRWRAGRNFSQELGRTRFGIEHNTSIISYWQSIIDGTARPGKRIGRASDTVTFWRRRLAKDTAHYAALTAARQAGLPADDAEIERAAEAAAREWRAVTARAQAVLNPKPRSGLRDLAARVRRLATQNDPDAMRDEIAAIATALDALA